MGSRGMGASWVLPKARRIHFCRQHVELGDVSTTFTPTPDMVVDFMTKQTQRLTHERHCRMSICREAGLLAWWSVMVIGVMAPLLSQK